MRTPHIAYLGNPQNRRRVLPVGREDGGAPFEDSPCPGRLSVYTCAYACALLLVRLDILIYELIRARARKWKKIIVLI